jgi:hypothetical protein
VAAVAKGNKIVVVVRPRVAAELLVMDFKVGHRSAGLTTPAVSPQYSLAEFLIFALREPEWCLF